jgi:hypothetical protein
MIGRLISRVTGQIIANLLAPPVGLGLAVADDVAAANPQHNTTEKRQAS